MSQEFEIDNLWYAIETQEGTDSSITFVVGLHRSWDEQAAVSRSWPSELSDIVNWPSRDTSQDDLESGKANLYDLRQMGYLMSNFSFTEAEFESLYFRIAIRGDDMWQPRSIFVWATRDSDSQNRRNLCIPMAMRIGSPSLSTELREGDKTCVHSLQIPRTSRAIHDSPFSELLVVMRTANRNDAGSNNLLVLQIQDTNGRLLVDHDLPDQGQGKANIYFVPMGSSLTLNDLTTGRLRLRIKGDDAWLPDSLFFFGLKRHSNNQRGYMVPLVHEETWPPDRYGPWERKNGWLSTTYSEGEQHIEWKL